MSLAKQYLEQLHQTASQLSEIANSMDLDAKHLIQENSQTHGKFEDQNIANDTLFAILCSINLKNLAENMITYCEQRLSDMQ
ncbi:hypothetical protein [Fortiea contorta]|uniref:hypothetical protein n=1 Tax=Fortiea contorta TaxID=1892405 RepID=UPI00034B6DE7|nr:hypothetical protein [Fortiea contorta]